jgi:hypothetical protein
MEIALITALTGIGFYLNKDGRKHQKTVKKNLINENENPSADNIYHSRHYDKVWDNEFQKSTAQHIASLEPDKTGFIGPTYKDRQNNKYDKNTYVKSDQIVQKESQIEADPINSTTRFPSSSANVFDTNLSLPSSEYLNKVGTMNYNDKRNNIPNPEFEEFMADGTTAFKTEKSVGGYKSTKVFGENTHNNMEPFFGGSIKQNTRVDANKTLLENFTGTNPVFAHKKEVKRMFPVTKNPYVNGLPVANNRETDRYIPSITKQNILPFEQQRVAPGLNKNMTDNTTDIGFHDSYRGLGKGHYKTVDELRVDPKITYKGRITGEKHYITNRGQQAPVTSRRAVDLSYTTISPGEKKEGFSDYKYRDNISNTGFQEQTRLDKDSIVLKNQMRNKYSHRLGEFPGTADYASGNKMYVYEKGKWVARTTIKEQTEDNLHSHINVADSSVQRHIVNPYDEAKVTIKQQTEDHLHSHINVNDKSVGRGQTYLFDDAKTTIKEQTEDHLHSHINQGNSESRNATVNRFNYLNADINGLKEQTMFGRKPTEQGAKQTDSKERYNIDVRKTTFTTYPTQHRVAPTTQNIKGRVQIGNFTRQPNVYDDKGVLDERINPYNVKQFQSNPYTQSLTSHIVPYNPAHPKK